MGRKSKLPITEELDFAYLLELMRPLHDVPEYACLPELFSILGHELLIKLCRYSGGETIKVPTLSELSSSVLALQWFYDINIKHTKSENDVPKSIESLYFKIKDIYNNA